MKYTERNHCHTTEQYRDYHEEHGVIPVDYYRRAPWFEKRIVKRFRLGRLCDADYLWHHLNHPNSPHFDHCGVIRFEDKFAFVTEPYVFSPNQTDREESYQEFVEECRWLASEIQCDWWTSPRSFWNPGWCARGVFYEGLNSIPYKQLAPRDARLTA